MAGRWAGPGHEWQGQGPRPLPLRTCAPEDLGRLLELAVAEGCFSAHLPRCLVTCQPPCSVVMRLTGSDRFPQVFSKIFFLPLQEVNTHSYG